jgi:hypothetical protein
MTSSADIISTLFSHGMILGRETGNKAASPSNTVLAARTSEGCTNPNCKAKKRSTHTTANCYWPGGGKEGQFPPNFGQRLKASVANTNSGMTSGTAEHFVLSVQTLNTPGNSGIVFDDLETLETHPHLALISKGFQTFGKGNVPTFMDSGASDTMFVSKSNFNKYTSITPRFGDSAKAVDGGFEIIGEGNVTQQYRINGKEHNITYTRALHTPTLNANLISVSALDKAGLTTTFGGGRGITRKADGMVILAGEIVNGMYVLETVDSENHMIPDTPIVMGSLSQPVSLEQWH